MAISLGLTGWFFWSALGSRTQLAAAGQCVSSPSRLAQTYSECAGRWGSNKPRLCRVSASVVSRLPMVLWHQPTCLSPEPGREGSARSQGQPLHTWRNPSPIQGWTGCEPDFLGSTQSTSHPSLFTLPGLILFLPRVSGVSLPTYWAELSCSSSRWGFHSTPALLPGLSSPA